jgi:hypothetical protein
MRLQAVVGNQPDGSVVVSSLGMVSWNLIEERTFLSMIERREVDRHLTLA